MCVLEAVIVWMWSVASCSGTSAGAMLADSPAAATLASMRPNSRQIAIAAGQFARLLWFIVFPS